MNFIQYLSLTSFSPSQILLFKLLLLLIPLSNLLYLLKNQKHKKIYSFFTALFLQLYFFTHPFIIYAQTTFIYLIVKHKRRHAGIIVYIQSIIFLSILHIYNQIYYYGQSSFNQKFIMMIMIWKYISFACSYEDGSNQYQLSVQQNKLKIQILPSFMDYMCYINFLPTVLIGPCIQYKIYNEYMDQNTKKKKNPRFFKQIALELIQVSFLIIIYSIISNIFVFKNLDSDYFNNLPTLNKIIYGALSVHIMRYKQISLWKIGRCSLYGSYMNNRNENLDGSKEIEFIEFETRIDFQKKLEVYNMNRKLIFKKYFCNRYEFKISKNKQVNYWFRFICIFIVNGIWFGFYPGYYLTFVAQQILCFLSQNTRNIRSYYRNYQNPYPQITQIILVIFSNLIFHHFSVYFNLLSLSKCYQYAHQLMFIPQIFTFILFIISKIIYSSIKSKQIAKIKKK